jgi:Mg2+ and Co2+ transporter CorA
MLPTLVFSFYGMNVSLPFADAPNAYVYILLSSVITIVAGYLLLSQRRF